jgi:hypothetical protein
LGFSVVSRRLTCALIASVASAAWLAPAGPAAANHSQITFFEAPRDLLIPAQQRKAFAELDSLGVRALRVIVYWKNVAPRSSSRRRPRFDATNPRNYRWGQYDRVMAEAARRHWTLLLTASGPVPRWATAGARDNLTRPSAREFGLFMTALARQYGRVASLWSIWNEPNHPEYLRPQFAGGLPASPRIYRALFQSGVAGLRAAGLPRAPVLMGETAPRGTGHVVAPLAFLRGALCLNDHYRKSPTCSALPVAGYSHHAYTTTAGPFFRPPNRDDVTIGVLSRLVRALDLAGRAGALPRGLPVYLTEFGIQSKPNPFLGVSLTKQSQYRSISEQIAWDNARVVAFSQYLLRDDPHISRPGSSLSGGTIGFQSGLRLANGRAKPSLGGFRLPLSIYHRGRSARLWGYVRPATAPTSVLVLVATAHGHFRRLASATTDAAGYWSLRSRYGRGLRWRVLWRDPRGRLFAGPATGAY